MFALSSCIILVAGDWTFEFGVKVELKREGY